MEIIWLSASKDAYCGSSHLGPGQRSLYFCLALWRNMFAKVASFFNMNIGDSDKGGLLGSGVLI